MYASATKKSHSAPGQEKGVRNPMQNHRRFHHCIKFQVNNQPRRSTRTNHKKIAEVVNKITSSHAAPAKKIVRL